MQPLPAPHRHLAARAGRLRRSGAWDAVQSSQRTLEVVICALLAPATLALARGTAEAVSRASVTVVASTVLLRPRRTVAVAMAVTARARAHTVMHV